MTTPPPIDHEHPEKYRLRNGCEVVRIELFPELDDDCRMVVVYRDGSRCGAVWLYGDGKYARDSASDKDLVEHDPVVRYWSAYRDGSVSSHSSFRTAVEFNPQAVHRYAYHASGKVRQIPLDATTDEGATDDQ